MMGANYGGFVGSPVSLSGNGSGVGSGIGNGSGSTAVMPSVAPVPHDRSQEVCKYFINGGCLRGAGCPFMHKLPDDRHLDVNGLGFILNANVQNAQKVPVPGRVGGSVSLNAPTTGAQLSPSSAGVVPRLDGEALHHGVAAGSKKRVSSSMGGGGQFSQSGRHVAHVSGALLSMPATILKTSAPPRYRPPEPYLEHNLTPVLSLPITSSPKEIAQTFVEVLLGTATSVTVAENSSTLAVPEVASAPRF